jgi:nucleoid DNA-binding protein
MPRKTVTKPTPALALLNEEAIPTAGDDGRTMMVVEDEARPDAPLVQASAVQASAAKKSRGKVANRKAPVAGKPADEGETSTAGATRAAARPKKSESSGDNGTDGSAETDSDAEEAHVAGGEEPKKKRGARKAKDEDAQPKINTSELFALVIQSLNDTLEAAMDDETRDRERKLKKVWEGLTNDAKTAVVASVVNTAFAVTKAKLCQGNAIAFHGLVTIKPACQLARKWMAPPTSNRPAEVGDRLRARFSISEDLKRQLGEATVPEALKNRALERKNVTDAKARNKGGASSSKTEGAVDEGARDAVDAMEEVDV